MQKIIAAPLTRFRVEQHLHLMTESLRLLSEQATVLGDNSLIPALQAAVTNESIAYEVEQGSIITKLIEDSDELRERYCSGLGYLVEMGLCHFDFMKAEAARVVKRVITKYGNMRAKTNVEETTAIRSMASELINPENLPYSTKLGAIEWITKIDEENEEFSVLFASRNKENGKRPSGCTRDARLITDPAYNAIVDRINALVIVNGEANYNSFITELNGIIEGLKTTIAQQQGVKKKTKV
jgi:hypothetical protein